jgi:hypothetical protein
LTIIDYMNYSSLSSDSFPSEEDIACLAFMDTSSPNFGLVVAYLLPGFIGLAGIALLVPAVAHWLAPVAGQCEAGVGAPVYAVLAATAMGMVLSCVRWIMVDHLHHAMGVAPPVWEMDRLEQRLPVFTQLVEFHYRYYQFYANTLMAAVWTYSLSRWVGHVPFLGFGTDLGMVVLCAALFAGSRDALAKYYARTGQLIGPVAEKDLSGDFMTNGCHHDQPVGTATSRRPETKSDTKREAPKREPGKTKEQASRK